MAQYRLHYAGCTFDLPDSAAAHNVVVDIEEVQARDIGVRREFPLAGGGSIQVFINRYTAIAVSAQP